MLIADLSTKEVKFIELAHMTFEGKTSPSLWKDEEEEGKEGLSKTHFCFHRK
jgi:hypothetical protein